ncbi:MAG: pyridoxamine 5'-phosphate oxidase family protein [Betaproteobacteria bacterium]|nr:MAG: pyridoxamine 5'-phosphate oxidase family protein [Betaproteobacteria bacterium]
MDSAIRKLMLELIETQSVLTLATLREDGWPQATTVAYANSGMTLFVATGADAQKVRNIRACDKVSVTVAPAVPEWQRLQGLSMAARAQVMESRTDIQQAARLLKKKFPPLAEFSDLERDSGWAFLRIVPKIVSVIDYTKGFGHTVLVKL